MPTITLKIVYIGFMCHFMLSYKYMIRDKSQNNIKENKKFQSKIILDMKTLKGMFQEYRKEIIFIPVNSFTVILRGFNLSPNLVTTSCARAFIGAM